MDELSQQPQLCCGIVVKEQLHQNQWCHEHVFLYYDVCFSELWELFLVTLWAVKGLVGDF